MRNYLPGVITATVILVPVTASATSYDAWTTNTQVTPSMISIYNGASSSCISDYYGTTTNKCSGTVGADIAIPLASESSDSNSYEVSYTGGVYSNGSGSLQCQEGWASWGCDNGCWYSPFGLAITSKNGRTTVELPQYNFGTFGTGEVYVVCNIGSGATIEEISVFYQGVFN
jgi:hypothetical protein